MFSTVFHISAPDGWYLKYLLNKIFSDCNFPPRHGMQTKAENQKCWQTHSCIFLSAILISPCSHLWANVFPDKWSSIRQFAKDWTREQIKWFEVPPFLQCNSWLLKAAIPCRGSEKSEESAKCPWHVLWNDDSESSQWGCPACSRYCQNCTLLSALWCWAKQTAPAMSQQEGSVPCTSVLRALWP